MAVQTVDQLRALVVDVVKVKQNTDPTKTQGVRLRQLLSDILDTVQDLVDELGLSVLSEMQNDEDIQNQLIDSIKSTINDFIAQMPPINTITVNSELPDFSLFATKLELFSKQYADLLNAPDLSVYVMRGELLPYAKKTDIPAQPDLTKYQLKSDVVTYDLSSYQKIADAFKGDYNNLTNKPVLFDGSWTSLTNKPTLFSGSYLDLTNKPTIPNSQVNADWNSASGVSQILNKPVLFSGAYSDLTGKPTLITTYAQLPDKPTIPASQVQTDWSLTTGIGSILNKPTLFNGSYTALTNIPTTFTPSAHAHVIADITGLQTVLNTIPAAQVNSDWNAITGKSQILNKPTLFSGNYSDLSSKPTLFSGSYTDLNSKPSIPVVYNSAGIINQVIKKWVGIVTPTTASGFTIDISSAGFTTILGVQVQSERNSANASDFPLVNIKSKTTTQLVLNIMQNNSAVVSVVGINVLSGLPLIFATNLGTILLHVEIIGI